MEKMFDMEPSAREITQLGQLLKVLEHVKDI